MRIMFAFVFSCTTLSTEAPKNSLLPVWSPWLCVLITVTMGLSVTVRMRSRIVGPQPASLVSTTTTPRSVMKTPVLPPLNASRGVVFDPVMT